MRSRVVLAYFAWRCPRSCAPSQRWCAPTGSSLRSCRRAEQDVPPGVMDPWKKLSDWGCEALRGRGGREASTCVHEESHPPSESIARRRGRTVRVNGGRLRCAAAGCGGGWWWPVGLVAGAGEGGGGLVGWWPAPAAREDESTSVGASGFFFFEQASGFFSELGFQRQGPPVHRKKTATRAEHVLRSRGGVVAWCLWLPASGKRTSEISGIRIRKIYIDPSEFDIR